MAAAFTATGRRVLAEITRNNEPKQSSYLIATKGRVSQRDMWDRIKYSSKSEIFVVLSKIFSQHPHLRSFLQYHCPSNTPCIPPADHPVFSHCFHCKTNKEQLHKFFGVRICGICSQRPFSRNCIMDYFGLTKSEADKIKRIRFGGPAGAYIYQVEDVIKVVKKKHGSLIKYCVQEKHGESWRLPTCRESSTYQLMQIAKTEVQKKKIILDGLQYSDKEELSALLKSIAREHLVQIQDIVTEFRPERMPAKPSSSSDPLLQHCFLCKEDNAPLHKFHDIKACARCMTIVGGSLSREQVMGIFHFSRYEADRIKRKTTQDYYGKHKAVRQYNPKVVVTAAKKKWGTLYNMVAQTKDRNPVFLVTPK